MSFFSGYEFFVWLFILLVPAIILGIKEKSLKIYRYLLSFFFIYQIYKETPKQLLYLLGYVVLATYIVKIYLFLRKKYDRNRYIYGHAIFLALLPLLTYKISNFYGTNIFGFLGISYICFRVIQDTHFY